MVDRRVVGDRRDRLRLVNGNVLDLREHPTRDAHGVPGALTKKDLLEPLALRGDDDGVHCILPVLRRFRYGCE